MSKEKKFVYEKPMSIDAGKIASVMGAQCSTGFNAGAGECVSGVNPDLVPACTATGAQADTACRGNGGQAGDDCESVGSNASSQCDVGTAAGWCNAGGTATVGG